MQKKKKKILAFKSIRCEKKKAFLPLDIGIDGTVARQIDDNCHIITANQY